MDWEWTTPEEIFFTGAVYVEDKPGAITHFLIVNHTICGLYPERFLPASHVIITCPECAKEVFYFKSGELGLM
jgi:hypothetical protein